MDQNTATRFWSKVQMGPPEECWIWKPLPSVGGYGQFTTKGKTYLAHRFSYELTKGPIPEGLTIDHLCRVRSCVNPTHLEAVTKGENLRRARAHAAGASYQRDKDRCPRGHLYNEANTYIQAKGSRSCRACERERAAEKRAQFKALVGPQPRKRRTHCNRGHAYAEHGYVNASNRQVCRVCKLESTRSYRARAQGILPPQEPKQPAATCRHGHEWTEANTYILPSSGQRVCRECQRQRHLANYHARQKQLAEATES